MWAPLADRVELVVNSVASPMRIDEARSGWWTSTLNLAQGDDYGFRLDGGDVLPDPRGRWLPNGVSGPSRAWNPPSRSLRRPEGGSPWRGVPWSDAVLYELHVGTFTPAGTLDAAIAHFDHLIDLGITLVELLPLQAFDGPRGWGYDGVAPFTVHEAYGGPEALVRFVDAAHARGLGVVLDVVHNHLGSSGNYLPQFGPYFTARHTTPWGPAINLDAPGSDEVRAYLLDSVRGWFTDFAVDGLRLDAVHELCDGRALTFLEEITEQVEELERELGRPLHLIAESDRNDPATVTARANGGIGLGAQWADDVHHGLHWWLTSESSGYYSDFASPVALEQVLSSVFRHDGSYSSFRGRRHGRPIPRSLVSPDQFVVSLQTHDQVGNRAQGERLSQLVTNPGLLAAGIAVLSALPFTPMLFMGEEWAASTPWLFMTSFADSELGSAVFGGRAQEFPDIAWKSDVPDPQDESTFQASKLVWDEREARPHAQMLRWYRDVLTARRTRHHHRFDEWDFVVEVAPDASWIMLRCDGVVTIACRKAVHVPVNQELPLRLSWGVVSDSDDGVVRFVGPGAAVFW